MIFGFIMIVFGLLDADVWCPCLLEGAVRPNFRNFFRKILPLRIYPFFPMENASSPDAESAVVLTEQLGRDLLACMTGKMPENPALAKTDVGYAAPRFGSIYFGRLEWFANGAEHYGMVKGGLLEPRRREQRPSPEVPFSPVTSQPVKKNRIKRTLLLPHGTLPPARRGRDLVPVASRILLDVTIPISLRKLRNLRYVQPLKEHFLEEARTILAGL